MSDPEVRPTVRECGALLGAFTDAELALRLLAPRLADEAELEGADVAMGAAGSGAAEGGAAGGEAGVARLGGGGGAGDSAQRAAVLELLACIIRCVGVRVGVYERVRVLAHRSGCPRLWVECGLSAAAAPPHAAPPSALRPVPLSVARGLATPWTRTCRACCGCSARRRCWVRRTRGCAGATGWPGATGCSRQHAPRLPAGRRSPSHAVQ